MMPKIPYIIRDIFQGMHGRFGRMFVVIFAVTIGVASATGVTLVMGGLEKRAQKLEGELGADCIALTAGQAGIGDLTNQHIDVLKDNFPESVISSIRLFKVSIDSATDIDAVVTDDYLFRTRRLDLIRGRFVDRLDVSEARRVTVLTESLAKELTTGVGRELRIHGTLFQVIGIIGADSAATVSVGGRACFIPRSLKPLWVMTDTEPLAHWDAIFLRAKSPSAATAAKNRAQQLLDTIGIGTGNASWITSSMLSAPVRKFQRVVGLVAGSVAFLCLALGMVALGSMMFGYVRERVPEIGLRMSLGARGRDIAALVLGEAGIVCGFSGLLGIVLARMSVSVVCSSFNLPIEWSLQAWLVPVICTSLVAGIASLGPACWAARMSPSEALRNE